MSALLNLFILPSLRAPAPLSLRKAPDAAPAAPLSRVCGVLALIFLVVTLGVGLGMGLWPSSGGLPPATVYATVTLPATELSDLLATAVRCDAYSAISALGAGASAVAITSYLPVGAPAVPLYVSEAANTAACAATLRSLRSLQACSSSLTVQGVRSVNISISAAVPQAAAVAARVAAMPFTNVLQAVDANPCLLPTGVTAQAFGASLSAAAFVKRSEGDVGQAQPLPTAKPVAAATPSSTTSPSKTPSASPSPLPRGCDVYVTDSGNGAVKKIPGGVDTPVVVKSGLTDPAGISITTDGDIYVSETSASKVKKIANGTGVTTELGSGYLNPTGVQELMGMGGVLVADTGNSRLSLYNPNDGNVTALLSGINPVSIVLSFSAGKFYISDNVANTLKSYPLANLNDPNAVPTTIGSGFNGISGISVTSSGDIFLADKNNNAVKMIIGGAGPPITIGSGFSQPTSVFVAPNGNVYVASTGNNKVFMIPGTPGNVPTATPIEIGSGFNQPKGVFAVC